MIVSFEFFFVSSLIERPAWQCASAVPLGLGSAMMKSPEGRTQGVLGRGESGGKAVGKAEHRCGAEVFGRVFWNVVVV